MNMNLWLLIIVPLSMVLFLMVFIIMYAFGMVIQEQRDKRKMREALSKALQDQMQNKDFEGIDDIIKLIKEIKQHEED